MSGHDPFSRPVQGGCFTGKDYTKYVRWTPTRIITFAICFSVPYLAIVIAVVKMTNPVIALVLTIPIILIGLIGGAMYWLNKANL